MGPGKEFERSGRRAAKQLSRITLGRIMGEIAVIAVAFAVAPVLVAAAISTVRLLSLGI
jgi:hypothetical protein